MHALIPCHFTRLCVSCLTLLPALIGCILPNASALPLSNAVSHVGNQTTPQATPDEDTPAGHPPIAGVRDYSFGYWLHGFRKYPKGNRPDVLCLETGHYGLKLDVADLTKLHIGRLSDGLDYQQALESGSQRLDSLPEGKLSLEVDLAGRTYRAVSAKSGREQTLRRLEDTWLWESGRLAQRFELRDLRFEDAKGNHLPAWGHLTLVGWPESLTLTAILQPDVEYVDGPLAGQQGGGFCVVDQPKDFPHADGMDHEAFTVELGYLQPAKFKQAGNGWLLCKNENEWEEGNWGFQMHFGMPSAVMNIGGGRENVHGIRATSAHFEPEVWHHLVLSYDGRVMRYFLNGVLQGERVVDRARVPGSGLLRLGQRADGQLSRVPGIFDNLRIWNRPLSAPEVSRLAANPESANEMSGISFQETFNGGAAQPPGPEAIWKDAVVRIRLNSDAREWIAEERVVGNWRRQAARTFTLACNLKSKESKIAHVAVNLCMSDGQVFPTTFDPIYNGHVSTVKRVQRDWKTGYTALRNYDEFIIEVNNPTAEHQMVPYLLDFYDPAQITGLCPILCETNGVPTGIPVQLSKNWHDPALGNYLRAFMKLPAPPGAHTYMLRLVYGFYGNLPSASHAQLSLVGYGGQGRWDQLAIGAWGETMCFDMDMSCTDRTITDVRGLMLRNGADGKQWGWTDAGWGGDWLGAFSHDGHKLQLSRTKTAYLAHGPCLSEVRYKGSYGANFEVDLDVTLRTLRTDDYSRCFQQLRYDFRAPLDAGSAWLFKVGGHDCMTPRLAYGNGDGLLEEKALPNKLQKGEVFMGPMTPAGKGPWWFGFPGGAPNNKKDWATGSRGLIIRSYKGRFGEKQVSVPTFTFPVARILPNGKPDINGLLTVPPGISAFHPGDWVEMELEWITLPRIADDYYGPNEAFRTHLQETPRSWKTIYREASGNDLQVKVQGGQLRSTYPVIIRVEDATVSVDIQGGVGAVPIRFEGLPSAKNYRLFEVAQGAVIPLDQSVHGEDFWQTDYHAGSNTYHMTYNLPLDRKPMSSWVFRNSVTQQPSDDTANHPGQPPKLSEDFPPVDANLKNPVK